MQQAVPGLVTEGSNNTSSGGDPALQALWTLDLPAAMNYTDDWRSWASNEPTIYANGSFVALLAYCMQE
jgi:hypothetical protein